MACVKVLVSDGFCCGLVGMDHLSLSMHDRSYFDLQQSACLSVTGPRHCIVVVMCKEFTLTLHLYLCTRWQKCPTKQKCNFSTGHRYF